jgi:hypothetical protein
MNSKHFAAFPLAFFFLLLILHPNCHAQSAAPANKLELRVNALSMPLLNFNVGLRLNWAHALKPELYAAVQAPLFSQSNPFGENPLVGVLGYGFTAYGGLAMTKGDWADKRMRWSFQLGIKAFHTGRYYWRNGGNDYSICGESDQMRLTIGPRVLMSKVIAASRHGAVEVFAGAGFRVGYRKGKYFHAGEYLSYCNSPGFVPSTGWEAARTSFVPTLHGGLTFVLGI